VGLTKIRVPAEYWIVEVRRSRRGFVLIATCIALTILLALAGFAIDVGRMYVIKSELQAFADAAALTGALELNGSESGIAHARAAAASLANGPNAMRWDMGTRTITQISASFAQGENMPDSKTWQARPSQAAGYRFIRVVATAPAPVIFLRVFEPLHPDFSTVAAASVAAKTEQTARLIQ
jgi:uncharacterized membrane protein